MSLSAGDRLGPYEIHAFIGAGGMGEVYRARDTRLNRTVAIKTLPLDRANDGTRRARFEREAHALAGLSHPHICTLYDIGLEGGVFFVVMEHLEGDTLADRIATHGLRLDHALRYAIEIAEALDAAHRQGFVHRDLKPGNVMVTPRGAKLLDFGLVTWRGSSADVVGTDGTAARPRTIGEQLGETVTDDGVVLGTVHYMAPEQIDGGPVDDRTDLFAFGAVLYEMLTRRKAFEGETPDEVMTAVREHDPLPLWPGAWAGSVQAALDHVVRRCIAKDADDRWQSARDVAGELRWIARTCSEQPYPASRAATSRARAVARAGVLMFIMAMAAGGAFVAGSRWSGSSLVSPATMRFRLPPPEGAMFSPSASLLAVSPDGRSLAFLAARPGGPTRIWVRQLDSLVPRELPGTDGALGPFWSPDSQRLGFFADGQLKIVNLLGEPPVVRCAFQTGLPMGTWGQDNTILVAGPFGIYRLSSTDGVPLKITALDPQRAEFSHLAPQLLPDGRHFLYFARGGAGAPSWVMLGSLDSTAPRQLFSAESQALYTRAGYLFFLRSGSLFAQPFDADRVGLAGDPIAVPEVEHVGFNPGNLRGMFSVSDNGVVAYRPSTDGQLTLVDRSGTPMRWIGDPGFDVDPALSPDGSRVAVSRYDPVTTGHDIWILDMERGSASLRVTASDGVSPVWSPDGKQIVFASRTDAEHTWIAERSIGGTGEERPFPQAASGIPTDWSPDGRYVVYAKAETGERIGRGTVKNDLWLLPLDTNEPRPLVQTSSNELDAQISPDGRWFAYTSDASGRNEIHVRSFPDARGHRQVSLQGGSEPHWRHDGRELFYIGPDQQLMAVTVTTNRGFQTGTPSALFKTRMDTSARLGILGRNQFVVSPDGQRFLINEPREDAVSPAITVLVNWRPPSPR